MNVKLTLATGALVLAGAAVPFSQSLTAYADSHSVHTGAQVHTQGKVHSKGKMSGKFDLQNTTNSIQSTVNQVQSSVGTTNMTMKQAQQMLHTDIKKAQQAHHDLIDALHQYINAMQAAISQGDTQALNIGLQGSTSIESNLHQALNIQTQLPKQLNSSASAVKSLMGTVRTHGQKGIQRVEAVAQKELAKANALESAATQLKQLAQQVSNQITKDGGTLSTTSTTHSSGNTTGTATGSVNTQGDNQGSGNTTTSGGGQVQGNPISPKSQGTNDTSSGSTDSSSGLSVQGSVQGSTEGTVGTQGTQSSVQGTTNNSLNISVN